MVRHPGEVPKMAEGTPLERVQVVNSGARVQIPPSPLSCMLNFLDLREEKLLTRTKACDIIIELSQKRKQRSNLTTEQ